jgi:regulator of RNase E activity RraA
LKYPVFTKAITMRSGKNRVYKAYEQIELQIGAVHIKPGDIIFADDCGVLVIPQQHINTVIERAKNIRQTEELIINSIKEEMNLASARKLHRYDQPWLSQAEKVTC